MHALTFLLVLIFSQFHLNHGTMPSGYSDYYTRYKIWPLSNNFVYQSDQTVINNYLSSCFNNATFYKHLVVTCDMFGNNSNITCASSLFVSHDDQAIVLVFRGSIGGPEVNEQLQFFNTTVPFPGGGTIHKFYYNGFITLWNGGIQDAFNSAKNAYPSYELWREKISSVPFFHPILYISQLGYFAAKNIKLVTFGEPRVGHMDYALRVEALVPYAYRVVHRNDIVPHLIPLTANYSNHKNEIWYNNTMDVNSTYTECDDYESPNCCDSVPQELWTWNDHPCFGGASECKKFSALPPLQGIAEGLHVYSPPKQKIQKDVHENFSGPKN